MKNTFEVNEDKCVITVYEGKESKSYEFEKDKDFAFVTDNGVLNKDKIIIMHGAIMNMADELGITVSKPEQLSSYSRIHYVLCCTATYKDRTEIGIGEATKENLVAASRIAQMYPYTTAYTRAYDKAVLNVLGFSGKIFSDSEITMETSDIPADADILENAETSENKVVDTTPPVVHPVPVNPDAKDPASAVPNTTEEKSHPTKKDIFGKELYGDEINPDVFVVTKGKYKDSNLTVEKLYEEDPETVRWFANKGLTNSEDFNKHIYSCRREMAKHPKNTNK